MGDVNGNGNSNAKIANAIKLGIAIFVFLFQLAGFLFAGALAWASLKSDLRDQATRSEMRWQQYDRDLARVDKNQLVSDAWARDLDVRLAGAGIVTPQRQTITVRSVPPEPARNGNGNER